MSSANLTSTEQQYTDIIHPVPFWLQPASGYNVRLAVLSAAFQFALLLNVTSFVIRARRKGFWVIRRTRTPAGVFVVPHPMVGLGVALGYLHACFNFAKIGANTTGLNFWQLCVWIPLWLVGWCFSWAVAVTPCLSVITTPLSTFDPRKYPSAFNIFFLGFPLAVIPTILTLAGRTSHARDVAFRRFQALIEDVNGAIEAMRQGLSPELSLTSGGEERQIVDSMYVAAVNRNRAAWWVWTGVLAVHCVVFGLASYFYLAHLRVQMQQVRKRNSTHPRDAQLIERLTWAYRTLHLISIMTTVVNLGYLGFLCT
ncbi:hypothetical protein MNV49_004519 [Pseudohyphozyma bogoriensis]|nr:hypothetical protein MNV49_004519 [Pseudohyphozyma bogoriensis]